MPFKNEIGTSSFHWFGRGLAGGLMLVAAANAASFFFRSGGIGGLLGDASAVENEALGFPLEVWRAGDFYGGWMIDYPAVGLNLLVGLGLGGILGMLCLFRKKEFNRWVADYESSAPTHSKMKPQFSVKSLLILTTAIAFVFAATSAWNSSPHLLGAIYIFGPLCLILIAMQPNQIRWQHRVVILVFVAAGLIFTAVSTGQSLGMTADQVLMGIFVSWTPQSAFVAFLITVGMIFQIKRKLANGM